jgi:2Fe-2S iron-sulfur cluster binding domain
MGVCGSCGMKVNGTPKLTCATFLSDYLPGPIRVEPLDYFPVVCTLPPGISRWLKLDLVHRAERKFGLRVIHVVAEAVEPARR